MTKGVLAIFHGLLGLGLSIVMWRLTGNLYAWAVLFGPGAGVTLWGLYRVFVLDDL
jgi:hypothetical protein